MTPDALPPGEDDGIPRLAMPTVWERVRFDLLGMRWVVVVSTRPRGGRFVASRATVRGPYWRWMAELRALGTRAHLRSGGLSWAAPVGFVVVLRTGPPAGYPYATLGREFWTAVAGCGAFVVFVAWAGTWRAALVGVAFGAVRAWWRNRAKAAEGGAPPAGPNDAREGEGAGVTPPGEAGVDDDGERA